MEYSFVGKVSTLLQEVEDITSDDIVGCSDEELNYLEELHPYKVKLPQAYRIFMNNYGKGIAEMRPVSDFFYKHLLVMMKDNSNGFPNLYDKEFFHRKITPRSEPPLYFPENAFIFASHEGYQFHFFYCDGEEDPITYFMEYNPEGKSFRQSKRYSELMIEYVEGFLFFHKELVNRRRDKLPVFMELKQKIKWLAEESEKLRDYKAFLSNVEEVIDFYKSIRIYDFFADRRLFFDAYYDLETTDPEIKKAIDDFARKAEEVQSFYSKIK